MTAHRNRFYMCLKDCILPYACFHYAFPFGLLGVECKAIKIFAVEIQLYLRITLVAVTTQVISVFNGS